MSFTWPTFEERQPLDGGRSWTARFDSYDQYHEYCYYIVRIFDGDEVVDEIMAKADSGTNEDWTSPEFLKQLTACIADVAACGKTNTAYTGPLSR